MSKTAAKKEKIQRMILAALVAVGGLYVYFELLLAPLSLRETQAMNDIRRLEPLIAKAVAQAKRTAAIASSDPHSEEARTVSAVLERSIPAEASVAWVPQRFNAFFKEKGVNGVSYRLTGEERDPEITGYRLSHWDLSLPRVGFTHFAKTLAEWENQEGLLQVTQLTVNVDPTDVENQGIDLKLKTIVKP